MKTLLIITLALILTSPALIDDGKSQDSYANYVCEILYNEGFRGQGVKVTIIDIEKLAYKQKWVTLGKASCE